MKAALTLTSIKGDLSDPPSAVGLPAAKCRTDISIEHAPPGDSPVHQYRVVELQV